MSDIERIEMLCHASKTTKQEIDNLLLGKPKTGSSDTSRCEDLRTYTVTTAAKKLNLCRKTVYKLIGSGEIAVIQMGNRKRVRHSAIIDYLTNSNHNNAN